MQKTPQFHKGSLKISQFSKLGKNVLLSILSVVIFFGSAEALTRIGYTPHKYEHSGMFEYDEEKIFGLRKNNTGIYKWGGNYTTNSHGYRGRELSVEKPGNTKRILAIGDSVTFGHGMNDDQTYPYYLERILNEYSRGSGKNNMYEVINTAVPGNAPFQEYYDLERGLKFNPDVIILQFTLNDVIWHPLTWIKEDTGIPDNLMEAIDHSRVPGLRKLLHFDYIIQQNSSFYLFLKDISARIRFKDPSGENIAQKAMQEEQSLPELLMIEEPEPPAIKAAWDDALYWVQRMTEMAKDNDVPLILLVTPYNFQLSLTPKQALPQRKMEAFSEEEKIYYVDMLEILRKLLVEEVNQDISADQITSGLIEDFWKEFFLDYDHPTAMGHELIANALHTLVLETLR